ncbi:MAG: alpha-D-ribose 1-methylphosphonate 5-triphosphate diphosphatase [Alphaproteobacteria bacterium]|nr:alpha-D-ribose 1-methylphosphonate 5-triphosphate diphosphatase [Alphaproteobacteria bacterium]
MTPETIFANARIVTPDAVIRGGVRVAGAMIAGVDAGRGATTAAIDFEGDYLLPGLVELHTDHLERHFTPRPGVRWPSRVAVLAHDAQLAAAGITTVLDALPIAGDATDTTGRGRGLPDMVAGLRWGEAAGLFRAEHHLHLRCEVPFATVVESVEPFAGDPLLRLVSLMDHTPGQRQFAAIDKYRQYYQGRFGFSDAKMAAYIAEQKATQARYGAPNRTRLVALCQTLGVPLASHDDATPEHIAEAQAIGVTIAEFPTTESAARAARAAGIAVMMGGPNLVLGGSHSGNVAAATLARQGHLDLLASDYVPSSLLHGAFLLTGEAIAIDLPTAVATVTSRPAGLVGMTDRGAIVVGKKADLIRVRVTEGGPIVRAVWRDGRQVV